MLTFQGLDPGQFVITNDPLTPFSQLWGLLIQLIDVVTFLFKLLILLSGQPVPDPVGFEISLFLKDGRRGGLKSA